MKRLKIASVANHCCFRVHKENLPLMNRGHEVHLIAGKVTGYSERYKTFTFFQNPDQCYDSIALMKDADVFHVHNEPSWFVNMIKSVHGDNIPVVLDVHDSYTIRYPEGEPSLDTPRITADERYNFQLADAHVFISDPMAEVCRNTFKLEQPYAVLPSYMPKQFYRMDSFRWVGGIVYEGRVDVKEKLKEYNSFFTYCDYRELAKELRENKLAFYIFAPNRDIKEMNELYNGDAFFMQAQPPDELVRTLGSHHYGILGNIQEHEAWKYALPNKLFDYLAAGIPVIAINAPLAGKFVEENGFGINVKTVEEIVTAWGKTREFRENIAKHRFDWCMEEHIEDVENLYRKLI